MTVSTQCKKKKRNFLASKLQKLTFFLVTRYQEFYHYNFQNCNYHYFNFPSVQISLAHILALLAPKDQFIILRRSNINISLNCETDFHYFSLKSAAFPTPYDFYSIYGTWSLILLIPTVENQREDLGNWRIILTDGLLFVMFLR